MAIARNAYMAAEFTVGAFPCPRSTSLRYPEIPTSVILQVEDVLNGSHM
jgi:hypothetical protein